MTYTRPAGDDPGNDASATDATVIIGALSDGLEALEVTEVRRFGGNRVVYLGDSLMSGFPTGATATDWTACWPTYASILSNQRALYVKNAGVIGERTDEAITRFSADVTAYSPTCVVLGLGTNDVYQSYSFSSFKTNMQSLVASIRAIGALPVLVTMLPGNAADSTSKRNNIVKWNYWIRDYASDLGLPLIDFYKALVDESTGDIASAYVYAPNPYHPNEAGQALMASTAVTVLTDVLAPWGPMLPTDNTNTFNLLSNGCMITDATADGIPDGWTWSGTGSPSLVDDGLCQGKWVRFGGSGSRSLSQSETVGGGSPTVSVGDTIAVGGKIRTASMGGTQTYTVTVTFTGAGSTIKPVSGLTRDISDGTFYQEYVVPSSTTSITVALSTSSGSGVVDFAQVGLFNLTTLAA